MQLATALSITLAVFILGCLTVYFLHDDVSKSPLLTYGVLGLTGLAALVWPIFAVRLLSKWIDKLK